MKKDVPSMDKDTSTISLPVYEGTEVVSGKVDITIPSGKKVDHLGIKIEMLGFVGTPHHTYISMIAPHLRHIAFLYHLY